METTKLARILKERFYERQPNGQVIFRNGKTMSKVADGMAWILEVQGEKSFETSTLSRVINSYKDRGLSPIQLEAFCKAIGGVSAEEKVELEIARAEDDSHRFYGIDIDLSISPDTIDQAERHLQTIDETRVGGLPQRALERAADLERSLDRISRKNPDSPLARKALLLRARVLFEKNWALVETLPLDKVHKAVGRIDAEIRQINVTCQNDDLAGLSEFLIGDAYYIEQDPQASVPHLRQAVTQLNNPEYKLIALRTLVLDLASLHEPEEHKKFQQEMRRMIDEGRITKPGVICLGLEGLGRSQGMLRYSEFEKTFEEAWKYHRQLKAKFHTSQLQEIQIVRSELIVAQYVGSRSIDTLEERGRKASEMAQQYGYKRYEQQINTILSTSLNR